MKQKHYLKFMAILIVSLIISLPIYTSNAYAQTLSIVRNSGQDEVQNSDGSGYLRSSDDIWTLIVNVVDSGQTVNANQLKVNDFTFDSCTSAISGYDCTYVFDYSGANLGIESELPVVIDYYSQDLSQLLKTKTTAVTTDGSGPSISDLDIRQDGSRVKAEMTLQDNPDDCSGIGKIEIYDSEINSPLKTVTLDDSELSDQIDSQCGENEITIYADFPTGGDLTRTGKVIVYDQVSNERSKSDSFSYDYNLPVIFSQSFALDNFGNYIPSGSKTIDVYLNVSEEGDELTASASSSDLGWDDEQATCTKVDYDNHVYTCVWEDVLVQMSQSVSLSVTVTDSGNTVTQPISKSFTVDSTPPTIVSFGAGEHDGAFYVAPDNNEVKVVFEESQSGIRTSSVKADLSGISLYGATSVAADNCTHFGSQWTCYWYDIDAGRSGIAYLTDAEDNVGNKVDTTSSKAAASHTLDSTAPTISDIEIYALGPEGQVDYYQSRDVLKINFDINDVHGATGEVDLDDIVSDFSGVANSNGIVSAACTPSEIDNLFECTALTPKIISGPESGAAIRIIAKDAAGNIAEEVEQIDILGVANEPEPDFWGVGQVSASPSSLDIATVPLIGQRVFFDIPLVKKNSQATLLSAHLDDCTGPTDKLASSFMLGNMFGSSNPKLVLELIPFTPDQALSFECSLNIFSRRGNEVLASPETETINVTIGFHQTPFDSQQDRLDEKIRDKKRDVKHGLWGTIGALNQVVKYCRIFCTLKNAYHTLDFLWNLLQGKAEALRSNPYTYSTAVSTCYSSKAPDKAAEKGDDVFTKFCKFISCEYNLLEAAEDISKESGLTDDKPDLGSQWYSKNAKPVISRWETLGATKEVNEFKTEAKLGLDPYKSIVVAIAYLCLPAVIHNLDKYRQIECRYISCLENEVKAGVVNIDGCKQLRSYQICKYWVGALFYAVPYVGLVDALASKIQSMLTDPIGLLRVGAALLCDQICTVSNEGKNVCTFLAFLFAVGDLVNDLISIQEQYQSLNSDYCGQMGLNPF